MIDKEHLEQTGLHALDLLGDAERLLYQRELRVNPHLRDALRGANEQLAAVALTAPQAVPPARVWQGIEKEISGRPLPATVARASAALRRRHIHPAWAAAAALAVLSGWLGVQNYQLSSQLVDQDLTQAGPGGTPGRAIPGSLSPAQGNGRVAPHPATSGDKAESVAARDPAGFHSRTMRAVTLPPARQQELERLRGLAQKSAPPPEGVADLRLIEMHPPGSATPARHERGLLAGKVAEAIAAAAAATQPAAPGPAKAPAEDPAQPTSSNKPDTPSQSAIPEPDPTPVPDPPAPAKLRGQGSAPSSDIIIGQGGTVNIDALNLHPDAQVVHQNFPADSEFQRYGLTRLDDGRVWDGNGGIWYRQPDGQSYLGQKAPAGFQPPDPDDPGPVSDTSLRPAPGKTPPGSTPTETITRRPDTSLPTATPPATSAPATPAIQNHEPAQEMLEPYALPVTGSDGQGMIVTQNLPPSSTGFGYALWSQGANGGDPVLLGFLPTTGGVNGVFAFDLPSGIVPTGYRITHQPLNDYRTPGSSILQGP